MLQTRSLWPSLVLLTCQSVVSVHSFGVCTCISAEGGLLPPLNNSRPALKTLKVLLEVPTQYKKPHCSFNHYLAQKVACDIPEGRDPV